MKEKNLELTVGVFVLIGLTIAAVMVIRFGSYGYKHESYPLTAVFSFTNGVVVGAPVRLAGVEVGKVQDLVFSEQGQFGVEVRMLILKGTIIRNDARPVINSLGIMGEKYIEFLPVTTTAPILKPGEKIAGMTPVALNELMEQGKKVASQIQNMISGWADKDTQDNVKKTAANLKNLTDDTTQNALKGTLTNLKEISGSPNKENFSQAIASFKQFSDTSKSVAGRLDGILAKNDESLKVIGPKLVKLIDSMNQIFAGVQSGQGTIGKLVKDESIAKDIQDFVQDIKANPWKLFFKTEEKKKPGEEKKGGFLFW